MSKASRANFTIDVASVNTQQSKRDQHLQAETKLNRNDFGVGTGSWAATMVVGNEVNVKINLEATSK